MKNKTAGLTKPVVIVIIVCFLGAAFHFGSRARASKPTKTPPSAKTTVSSATVAGTGSIVVQTTPVNAEVKVGAQAPQKSPFVLRDQKPGKYPVQVTLQNYEDWTGEVSVTAGRSTDLAPALVRSTGDVLITSPVVADVYSNNSKVGETPLTLTKIPTGTVNFKIRSQGYTPTEISGIISRNTELHLNVELQKWSGPQEGKAWSIPSTGITMLWIPPGTYHYTHLDYNLKTRQYDKIKKQAKWTVGYWLGQTEITQGQWTVLMEGNPSKFKGRERPVENISYEDAVAFCKKMNEREKTAGRLPEGYRYGIPDADEWAYACKAGSEKESEDIINASAWYYQNSQWETHPVKQKRPNHWGIYDMYGNVSEWCNVNLDPCAHEKGGSWNSKLQQCLVDEYKMQKQTEKSDTRGFRLSLTRYITNEASTPDPHAL